MIQSISILPAILITIIFISSYLPLRANKITISPEAPEIFIFNDSEMVPLPPLAGLLDIEVTRLNKTFTITRQRRNLTITLQSVNALVNGREVKLPATPFESNGVLYLPLAILAEALGGETETDINKTITRLTLPGLLPALEMKRVNIPQNQQDYRETDSELFIMDINGDNLTRLTFNNTDDGLLFPNIIENAFYFTRDENFYRRVLTASNPFPILQQDENFSYSNLIWDDATQIILGTRYHIGARSELFAMRADGSGLRILARGAMPSLNADGKRIVFEHRATADDDCSVGLYNVATGDITDIANGCQPCFSPNGSALIFMKSMHFADNKIGEMICSYIVNGHDAGTFYEPTAREIPEDEISAYFSPDSANIIFLAGNPHNIYLMKNDRSARHAITRDGGYTFARFIPDGTAILAIKLCYNNTRHDIFRMGPEGEAPIRISGELAYKDIREFLVTPNGEQIIFSATPELAD